MTPAPATSPLEPPRRPSNTVATGPVVRDDPETNPNSLHNFHTAKRGPKNIPAVVMSTPAVSSTSNTSGAAHSESAPKDPGHAYARTRHIRFEYFDQRVSNAPFGYEHFVSLPPAYDEDRNRTWPLVLFLHGAGESQRGEHESYASIRHGVPKVILCYDKLKSDPTNETPSIDIPLAPRLRRSKQTQQGDRSTEPVPRETCELLAENFITVTPSLNMDNGYGWNAAILSALLDEMVDRFRVDLDRIHVTGFSMGGYGTWDLALHSPHRFATLAPICGGGDHLRVSHIKHVPHWVFHGDRDDIIPVRASIQMVTALQKTDAKEVNFKRYPDLMHDSWTPTYNNPDLYRWMLSHRRDVKGDEEGAPPENKVVLGQEQAEDF
ncbi:uncharacterized protein Z520_09208 [Fonsecaea multimorphosa CBS 102226]|uniref:Phospholipase/carboxylesterase/thioesterase domain-containing protein n=1 Tax=Fonsecaea multimorphosa CBS 102226 TaxID=1442371 RepID=A0A0D2JWL9_9EURO|nr:uncharacterized protein Z520_09208 [Fonsecaea multimorphosa CBS 102226]KIX94899.1 hypothetical protein Z520_09208 [Fonsecaea multimorphosa CBS 102226]OAL20790.1 hypothetical protein AYO22_08560 [Fonsecaea multimorphosa]